MRLWGGRFTDGPAEALWSFTVSAADRRLLSDDVTGSIAHVNMLAATEILDDAETVALLAGLESIAAEAASGEFVFDDGDEDVHSAVERRLGELVGSVGGKLHTGRSRNDQVALDLRLYLRRAVVGHVEGIRGLVGALVAKAEGAGDTIVASYTHMQHAQPVPLGHHLLAYCWMLRRDVSRFESAASRMDSSPLGAGAGGGSSFQLDPELVAAELGFSATFDNSMDAVASRDVASEYAFCCAQTMVHLSRLAEELVLWTTAEFGWATYADAHTTGSSAMPQKKNPDIAELVRGRAAGSIGDLTSLLALQKGLPLTYNRDLQEDKDPVFRARDTLTGALHALAEMISGATFDPPAPSSWVGALDLAEVLAGRGVPFREAHDAVGRLVASLLEQGRTLAEVTAQDLTGSHASFRGSDVQVADPAVSVERRSSPGGGSFASVATQISNLRQWLGG